VQASADEFVAGLDSVLARPMPAAQHEIGLVDAAVEALHETFDFENGGFGERPKFPPYSAMRFLLEYLQVRPTLPGEPEDKRRYCEEAETMVRSTLENMMAGGIHDWVGGGVHRYATDERWFLPHFEKVTADNAQLVFVLTQAKVAGVVNLEEGCRNAVEWLISDMQNPDGSFATAVDADAEGEEGTFTTWPYDELVGLVGEENAHKLGAETAGNSTDEATGAPTGRNLLLPPGDGELAEARETLRVVRAQRTAPATDTKAIAAVNGLVISCLARAGVLAAATVCADLWIGLADGDLPHMIQDGVPIGQAFLDDVVFLADGLLDLAEATGEFRFEAAALRLIDVQLPLFADPAAPGFFYSKPDPSFIYRRTKPILDSAMPGSNAVLIRVLRRLGRWQEAGAILAGFLGWGERIPTATETLLGEAMQFLSEGATVAATGETPQLRLQLDPNPATRDEDGWAYVELVVDIPQGCHINSESPAADWLIPTQLEAEGVYAEAAFPEGDQDQYEGQLVLPVRLQPKSGTTATYELRLTYQLCTESACFAPEIAKIEGHISDGG